MTEELYFSTSLVFWVALHILGLKMDSGNLLRGRLIRSCTWRLVYKGVESVAE
jgi:hypothetical protein